MLRSTPLTASSVSPLSLSFLRFFFSSAPSLGIPTVFFFRGPSYNKFHWYVCPYVWSAFFMETVTICFHGIRALFHPSPPLCLTGYTLKGGATLLPLLFLFFMCVSFMAKNKHTKSGKEYSVRSVSALLFAATNKKLKQCGQSSSSLGVKGTNSGVWNWRSLSCFVRSPRRLAVARMDRARVFEDLRLRTAYRTWTLAL